MNPSTSMNARRRAAQGLSLLEVLIGTLLISFALLGLVSLQARTVQLSSEAEDVQRASLLANELGSLMWAANTTTVPDDQLQDWRTRLADASRFGLPGGSAEVTTAGRTARITITWTPPRAGGSTSRYITDVVLP